MKDKFNAKHGTICVNKAIENSHELYFKYWRLSNVKEKSKCFFKMIKAEEILGKSILCSLNDYKKEIKYFIENKKEVYKPLLRLINETKLLNN